MTLEPSPPDDRATVAVGMLGYGFMGKAHSNALKTLPYIFWPDGAQTSLRAICGRTESSVREAATRYGWEHWTTDWRDLVDDPEVEVFVNVAPDAAHHEPTLAAIEAGQHVVCEKPLSNDRDEALALAAAASRAGVLAMTCFNYRFMPAVRLAYDLIHGGELGEIHMANFRYAQEWRTDPDGELPTAAGALDVIGCHAVDQARHLVGEIEAVSAVITSPVTTRDRGDPGDTVTSVVTFANGASGTIAATLVAPGRKNHLGWEINGSKGSVTWDLENLNVLRFHRRGAEFDGFKEILVTEQDHPLVGPWWPSAHILGWEHGHINMWAHFVRAVTSGGQLGPEAATFDDGARAAEVAAAIRESADTGQQVSLRRGPR